MGEVYRATDTRLGREVALKVLPEAFAADPVRLARFEREARLLASLNHPNIAHLYAFESATLGGRVAHVLVMELVEGEDLKVRLGRGRIPLDAAIGYAGQIAEALEEAHAKGIVHRDLKPGNVKLTPDGKVKVLDFGLAKAWAGERTGGVTSSADLSQSPTLANSGTAAGIIVGTAAYMSPEQARGKPVDRRADIWAFGVLLYEMLSGRRLFDGETVTDVLAAVVRQEIAWDALPGETPASVRRLLVRCLDRDPRLRLQDIGEARIALGGAAADAVPADPAGAARAERRGHTRERWAWAALALVPAGLAAFLGLQRLASPPATRPAAHFLMETPAALEFPDLEPPALSPDGRYVVFVGRSTGGAQLWIRPLDSLEARTLPGTENASGPFWSADGSSVAFAAGGEVRKLALAGGTVQRVCLLPRARFVGGTWSEAGTIVFSTGGPSATLYQVPAAGGEAAPLTTLD
jgi:hypothetical protein